MSRVLLLLVTLQTLAQAADLGPDPTTDPDAPTVGASLDRTEALLGDRLTLTVSAVAKAGMRVTLAEKLDLGKLEILDRDDGDTAGRDLGDGRHAYRFVLGVAGYELGDLEIPSLKVSYSLSNDDARVVTTAPLLVHISGLIKDDPQPGADPTAEQKLELQPLRPVRSAFVEDKRLLRILRWAGLVAGGLVVAGLAFWLIRRAMRRTEVAAAEVAAAAPKRPPDEVAIEKLRALREAANFSTDLYRPLYFAVAEVVREYLGARYGFDSLELTSSELMEALVTRAPKLAAPDGEVARFLDETDLVKFAKTGSTDVAAAAILTAAEALVLSTSAVLESAASMVTSTVRPNIDGDPS